MNTERHTYGEWQSLGRQVQRSARRGSDGRFAFDQTEQRLAACLRRLWLRNQLRNEKPK